VLAIWALAACAGAFAWSHLGTRLSGAVEVPGSSSQRAAEVLEGEFGESSNGSFAVLFDAPAASWGSPRHVARVEASLARAGRVLKTRSSPLRSLTARVSYATLPTELTAREAQARAAAVERALARLPATRIELTGFPIVARQLGATIAEDLRRAELVALPLTALILLLFFGSLAAAAIPLLFGLATILVTIGLIWLESWLVSIPIYATNVVTLVGIALAVDYSLLYVARFREEAQAGRKAALEATARTAGRALAISGTVVAAGLAPLVLVPVPFFSGLGLATVAIPLVSTLAAVTLLPALLEVLAPRLERRRPRLPWGAGGGGTPASERLAAFVMRRSLPVACAAAALLTALALPALELELTGGSGEFARAGALSSARVGEVAALAPTEVVIDSGGRGGALAAGVRGPERRLLRSLVGDRAVRAVQAPSAARSRARAVRLGLRDPSARFTRVRVSGASPSGSPEADVLVERLRSTYVPAAGFGAARVWVGGPAAGDRDFVAAVVDSVPTLVLVIAAITFALLTVLLGSPVLSLKAVAMSAISVAAACGVLVAIFQLGWAGSLSPAEPERIVAWVPVLLFASLFGISTDYEVFMVARIREEWLRRGDNELAVRTGLRLVGPMITASALVMLVIFSGFTASRIVALQQFGVGLVAGVLIDATIVRLLLVPALMKLMGRWNWSVLPGARLAREGRAARGERGR
jgi:trehalose monomycolate/heme transporter